MNRRTNNGNLVTKPPSHQQLTTTQRYTFLPERFGHWDTGNGPVWIRPDTGGGELHELIEKAIASRPKRPKVIDPATGQERRNESPFPPSTTFCSQT